MSLAIVDLTSVRRRKAANGALAPNLLGEITEALLELGGAAHRDAVIERVSLRRGSPATAPGLRSELIGAFEAACESAETSRRPAMLCRPFGSESRRWAISKAAIEVLRTGDPGAAD